MQAAHATDRSHDVPALAGTASDPESTRLAADATRTHNWKRWGTYLAERQWGTVREDYSEGGSCWEYFPHDHARSRAYRWGEDGLLGWTDRENRLCLGFALWNGKDPILKERLFGLTGPEGNHGEDVKECYFYLDSTPTCSYAKALYRYPQAAYPYTRLVDENRRRGRGEREFELTDAGVFDDARYFDVVAEYAKAGPEDTLVRVTIANHGPEPATLHVLPTLWLRNTWSWGRSGEGYWPKGRIARHGARALAVEHPSLGRYRLAVDREPAAWLFTENETNVARLYGGANPTPYVKDAFHEYVVHGRADAVNPEAGGSKAAALYRLDVPAGREVVLRLRLTAQTEAGGDPFGRGFEETVATRLREADAFYAARTVPAATAEERAVARQAYAALLWTRQFFHYDVRAWLEGDPAQPPPPASRWRGRNADWQHLYNRDVVSLPEKWEYPWYAAWDLAFHMLPMARVDPEFAKGQLVLFLREWFMHPNGQLPAYEFAFGDVNPPVHAWAAWRVYKMTGARGARDRLFLERVFQKLLINFTWWVNRKDSEGKHIFGGGFLGMDNIGVFDRSQALPTGGTLEQADGTAWMGFYCATLLSMALELSKTDPAYEDMASKFFEHFIRIADAVNVLGGSGLWCPSDGFYYDQLNLGGTIVPLRVRSMVGLLPLIAVEVLEEETLRNAKGFRKRMEWFLTNRPELHGYITCMREGASGEHRLLALPTKERLVRVLRYMLDENEFLSPYGIRSVSRFHADTPFVMQAAGQRYTVDYEPGESTTGLFGGNSNWRGPIWFPINYLLVEALERYHHFYGDDLKVECPTGSGRFLHLGEVAQELAARLARIFLPGPDGRRPYDDTPFAADPRWRDHLRFHEYFDGDSGRGLGARFQGWTLLATRCLDEVARRRGSR